MIWTVGYEGATQAEVVDRLRAAGIECLVDVRAVASSRRAGFSKTILRESLADAEIDYRHLRALGTPKAGREAARKGRNAEMRAIFAGQLATPEAVDAFSQLAALARVQRVAMLCFEADPAGCHRRVLAERLREEHGIGWTDL